VTTWQVGPYVLSSDGVLRMGGVLIPLSPLQRKLLLCFVRHAGKLIERPQLLQEVWGHTNVSDVSLARAVHSLRQVFDQGPLGSRVISTSYGSGYVFSAPVLEVQDQSERFAGEISTPSPLALEYYLEARVAFRHLDPLRLARCRTLLERSLQTSPTFSEAILFLVAVHLNGCRWGLEDSLSAGAAVEQLLNQAEQLNAPPEDLLPLRAETISLLHWQPKVVDDTFGNWLPQQLGYGFPLLSWVRHLLACGRAQDGLDLLEPHLDGSLPMGWTLAAHLTFQQGQTKAAIEMLHGQLRIDGSLPASQLLLAMLQAHSGDRAAALRSLSPFGNMGQSFQAVIAYVLARSGEGPRAEALMQQAKAPKGGFLGMASLWGLNALLLGHQERAEHFFHQAVQHRCYQAPFLAQSPLLDPFGHEPSVVSFRQQMACHFHGPKSIKSQDKRGGSSLSLSENGVTGHGAWTGKAAKRPGTP
jgi:DNA-binding winged helix-turn-helix (wHTH) protein